MRVFAFWAGAAGLVVVACQAALVALTALGTADAPLLGLLYQVAAGAQAAFTLMLVLFFFFYAVSARDGVSQTP